MKEMFFPNSEILLIPIRYQQSLLQLRLIKPILKLRSIFPDVVPYGHCFAPGEFDLGVLGVFEESAEPAGVLVIGQELQVFGIELEA
jgi:hypothetical protein